MIGGVWGALRGLGVSGSVNGAFGETGRLAFGGVRAMGAVSGMSGDMSRVHIGCEVSGEVGLWGQAAATCVFGLRWYPKLFGAVVGYLIISR